MSLTSAVVPRDKYDTELKKAAVRPATMAKKRVFTTFQMGGADGDRWPAATKLYPLSTAGATVASVSLQSGRSGDLQFIRRVELREEVFYHTGKYSNASANQRIAGG